MRTTRAWTPVRRGKIYCSPACGGECTYQEFLGAQRDAAALLAKMRTAGWEADVSENLGWHFAVRHPKLDVSISGTRSQKYSAAGPTWLVGRTTPAEDPNQLIDQIVREFQRSIRLMTTTLTTLKGEQ